MCAPQQLRFLEDDVDINVVERLAAGALAGMVATTLTYPLDLVRTRLSIQTEEHPKYTGE